MPALTGIAWTRAPRAQAGAGPKSHAGFEALSGLFAVAALAVLAVTMAAGPDTDGAASDRAASAPPPSAFAPTGGEMMFAGYTGVPFTYPSDVTIKKTGLHDFTARDVAWDGRPFVNPIYYGARIVRWTGSGRTGAMLDFTHSKAIARLDEEAEFTGTLDGAPAPERAVLRSIFRRLEASHGHNMLTMNGLLRVFGIGPRLHPYVGAGLGVSLPHSEVQLASAETRTYEYQVAGPVAQALLGVEIRTARMSYFVEYKFTLAPYTMPLTGRNGSLLVLDLWRQFQEWRSGEEPPGGVLTTNLVSHQGIFGLGIRSASAVAP